MSLSARVGLSSVVVVVSAAVWFGLPMFAATGLALDHPASAHPDDPAVGVVERSTSWFPPGIRYEWTGAVSGTERVAVDPWRPGRTAGWLWTALFATGAGMALRWVSRSSLAD